MKPIRLCFYQRIAVIVVGVFMLIMALFFAASTHLQTQTRYEAEQKLHQNLAAHLVDDNPLLRDGVYDYEALKNLFHTLMLLGPRFEFYYLDSQGGILTHSAANPEQLSTHINIEPIKTYLSGTGSFPFAVTTPKMKVPRKYSRLPLSTTKTILYKATCTSLSAVRPMIQCLPVCVTVRHYKSLCCLC